MTSPLTIAKLIEAYTTDPDSGFHQLRYPSRVNARNLLNRIATDYGHVAIEEIEARELKRWHEKWLGADKTHVAMAHAMIAQLRTVMSFGSTILNSAVCRTTRPLLGEMRFKMPKPRTEALTAGQVIAIRRMAHERGWPSIAFAQAMQFSFTMRQKDIIGEIVPADEPCDGLALKSGEKWHRGLHWREVDTDLILRHVTSKRQKPVEIDLKLAPMVLEEFKLLPHGRILAGGPMVVCELTGEPFRPHQWRRQWRMIARAAGVPDHVKNMDTRAGAITEALSLGAGLEAVRKTATHSTSAMTQKYSRADADATAEVMTLRAQHHATINR